jgi:hypothetical protein
MYSKGSIRTTPTIFSYFYFHSVARCLIYSHCSLSYVCKVVTFARVVYIQYIHILQYSSTPALAWKTYIFPALRGTSGHPIHLFNVQGTDGSSEYYQYSQTILPSWHTSEHITTSIHLRVFGISVQFLRLEYQNISPITDFLQCTSSCSLHKRQYETHQNQRPVA